MNRIRVENARCILLERELNKTLWAEAVLIPVHISPTRVLNNEMLVELYGVKPNCKNLGIFGRVTYFHIPKSLIGKKFESMNLCWTARIARNFGVLRKKRSFMEEIVFEETEE